MVSNAGITVYHNMQGEKYQYVADRITYTTLALLFAYIFSSCKMSGTITIKMHDKEVEFDLTENKITSASIKSACLLTNEAIVSLSYELNGRRKFCQSQVVPEPCFVLPADWQTMQFNVESDRLPSRPSTPFDSEGPNPKKRKVYSDFEQYPVDGHLAASIGRYALYYNTKDDNYKRCAVPLTPRLIATYRHGDNKMLKKDDEIIVNSWTDANLKVATRVVKIFEEFDVIILKSNGVDVCDRNLLSNSIVPRKGMRYTMMGYSIIHNRTNNLSFSTGIIASDVTKRSCYTGTSGSFKGDSGGGCWSEDGRLMGIQVAVEKVPHTSDNGRPASPAVGGRCLIVPLISFEAMIQDLLPKEDSDDEAEWNN